MTAPMRGSNVFLKEDIEAILRALWLSNAAALRASGGNNDYATGYAMAWVQVATALGMGREMGNWQRQMDWYAEQGVTP